MFTFEDLILLVSVLVALIALGAVIAVSNERVRRATLEVRDVARAWALEDLAMKHESARRAIQFENTDAPHALSQIALDVTGARTDFADARIAPGNVPALIARTAAGVETVFTPSAKAFLKANPAYARRVKATRQVSALEAGPFVAEELAAIGQACGLTALPRTEQWEMLSLGADDHSIMPRSSFRLKTT